MRATLEDVLNLDTVLWFHREWFYVAIGSTGLVGLWGVIAAIAKREPTRAFVWARGVAIGAILVQVAAGVYMYSNGLKPGNAFHVFYGVVIVVTLTLAYLYRTTMARKPALTYGILLLFVMGLGLRAWANVG
ncbi:MAG: hypothetical protein BMS9Abin20_1034 [Acidimicrobiia bacterium]|nr:MAG: hypothetical protein BMS9Abin20_1034 [Acidimicrobiia bacterium]